jgi:hypothetical protein
LNGLARGDGICKLLPPNVGICTLLPPDVGICKLLPPDSVGITAVIHARRGAPRHPSVPMVRERRGYDPFALHAPIHWAMGCDQEVGPPWRQKLAPYANSFQPGTLGVCKRLPPGTCNLLPPTAFANAFRQAYANSFHGDGICKFLSRCRHTQNPSTRHMQPPSTYGIRKLLSPGICTLLPPGICKLIPLTAYANFFHLAPKVEALHPPAIYLFPQRRGSRASRGGRYLVNGNRHPRSE